MTYHPNEMHLVTNDISSLVVNAVSETTTNPFLGMDTTDLTILENSVIKTENIDYLADSTGTINFITIENNEKFYDAILKLDSSLYSPDFIVYDNGQPLIKNTDYRINIQGGWINLLTSAFPGHVYSITYTNKNLGLINNEILLGTAAQIVSTNTNLFTINSFNNIFKISVNGEPTQSFDLPIGDISISGIVSIINASATGFLASTNNSGGLILTHLEYGPTKYLVVKNGTANDVLGFTKNTSVSDTCDV